MAKSVTLMAVGDIMLGEMPLKYKHGVLSVIKKYGLRFPFEKVQAILQRGDLVFGNLEFAASTHSDLPRFESEWMRAPPGVVKGLKHAGFNVLSVANNHVMDHGPKAFEETLRTVEKQGLAYCGAKEFLRTARIIKINGLKIGFLSYCFVKSSFNLIISLSDIKGILRDIKAAKKQVKFLIVSLHWGDEFMTVPSKEQEGVARKVVDAGADVILGHHPHVLQKIEQYNGKIIAYSLGNFVFDMWQKPTRLGAILEIELADKLSYKIHCIKINKRFQPELYSLKFKSASSLNEEYKSLGVWEARVYRTSLRRYFITHLHKYPFAYTIYMLKRGFTK